MIPLKIKIDMKFKSNINIMKICMFAFGKSFIQAYLQFLVPESAWLVGKATAGRAPRVRSLNQLVVPWPL